VNSNVEQLVQAMAVFDIAGATDVALPPPGAFEIAPLIAAVWQAA
jgi:hypothetical protein